MAASDSASDLTPIEVGSTARSRIGARLAHIRASATQREWAESLGIPLRTYQNYERGEREPDLRAVLSMWGRGWNLNWLLTGEGPERLEALKQGGSLGPGMQPEMMQKAVESAIGVFQRFNKLPSASQLARASVLLYLMFTDTEPDPTQPVDQLLARIVSEQAET